MISVIIPIYNGEKYIEKCIDSVLSQSYKNFEIILINDGSKDNTAKILKNYEKNEKIRIFNQKNMGVAKTRNKGIKLAKGEYIIFIDNDDFIDKDYIENYVKYIKDNDVIIGGYRRINIENKIFHTEKLTNNYWSKYIITAPWSKIYKKSFLIQKKIEFLNYGIGEDVYFCLVLFSFNPKIKIINYVGYNWFFNSKSVSNTSQKGLKKDVDILFLLEKIINKYEYIDDFLYYYLVRYYVWYLLFSGRNSNSKDFIKEYIRIKKWYVEKNIKLVFSPFSFKIKGESFKNRIIVFLFIVLEKFKLIPLFAKLYCKKSIEQT